MENGGDQVDSAHPLDPVEALVAECLERSSTEGSAAIAAICDAHPAHAASIRRRLDSLRRIGLHAGDADDSMPGSFGRYRILEKLGQGGMGVVYLALDERLGRKVALKAGALPFTANERARARFEREVRAAAQLEHPRIVPIFDVGETGGIPYFTMQYVEGATLADLLASLCDAKLGFADLATEHLQRATLRGPAGTGRPGSTGNPGNPGGTEPSRAADGWGRTYVESVCRIVIDVADALEHAHANGVIHRDVKPSNILVGRDGRAQLFDLGLAHLDDEPAITRTGDFAGTPQYVSPEQLAGRPEGIDRRTDVYSLGVTLYEMLTLRAPFVGRNAQAIFKQIVTKEPPLPRRLNPLVPRDLETICLTAIEKDPARRYPSAHELGLDLRRFLRFQPVQARPAGRVRRGVRWLRRNPAIGAASALALLIAIGTPVGLLVANALIAEERDRAEQSASSAMFEAARAERVAEFLVELFRTGGGEAVTAREMLERGAARIDVALSGQPLVQASLMESVGRVWQNLGLFERALPLLDQALAIRQRELGLDHVEVARLLHTLSTVHAELGDEATVEALARRSAASFERSGHGRDPQAAACRVTLGDVAARRGELERARAEYEAALILQREHVRAWDGVLAHGSDLDLGAVSSGSARGGARAPASLGSSEVRSERARPESAGSIDAASPALAGTEERALADTLEKLGRLELALAGAARERAGSPTSTAPDEATTGASGDRPSTASSPAARTAAEPSDEEKEHIARASAALRESLAIRRLVWDPLPADIAASWTGIAEVDRHAGDLERAREGYEEALAIYRRVHGELHPGTVDSRLALAELALARGECTLARTHVHEVASAWTRAEHAPGRDGARIEARLLDASDAVAACRAEQGLADEARSSAAEAQALRAQLAEARAGRARSATATGATPYALSFQSGITALQSGRYAEATLDFERCLALDPRQSVCAYNIACAAALSNDLDLGFAWLEKAIDIGFGLRPNALDSVAKDSDLRALHDDPRFARVVERMAAIAGAAEAYAATPAVHVPDALLAADEWPLLIVLHADGATKRSIVEGPWRRVADELGFVLVAPSGRFPDAGDPELGMHWFDDADAYEQRSWLYERPVIEALRAIRARHRIARERIVIAGEGTGASVAFRVAARAPGLYRGVLLEGGARDDGALVPVIDERAAQNLSALGLRVRVRLDGRQGSRAVREAEELAARFALSELDGSVEVDADLEADPAARRIAALRALLAER